MAEELDWTPRRIERWFRIKRNQQKSTVLRKFCEVGWRFCFYSIAFAYGVYVVHDEDFAKDVTLTVDISTWPHHNVKDEYLVYYAVEGGFYASLLISLFNDVRRSDFYVHAVHHFLTIGLLVLSWTSNFARLGMLVLIAHDIADAWLELAKLCIYIKYNKMSDFFFAVFFIVWIASRILAFPLGLIYPAWTTYAAWYRLNGHFYVALVQIVFLSLLFCLHMIWTYHIVRHLVTVMFKEEAKSVDERSASEASEISSGEPANDADLNCNAKLQDKKTN